VSRRGFRACLAISHRVCAFECMRHTAILDTASSCAVLSRCRKAQSLICDIGPWKGENLLAGIESFQKNAYHPFFQKNAYHPFAACGNLNCGKAGPIPLSTTAHNINLEQTLPTRSMEHFCDGNSTPHKRQNFLRQSRHIRLSDYSPWRDNP